jgi:hypothetical protein
LEGRQGLAQVFTGCTVPDTVALTFDDGPYLYMIVGVFGCLFSLTLSRYFSRILPQNCSLSEARPHSLSMGTIVSGTCPEALAVC